MMVGFLIMLGFFVGCYVNVSQELESRRKFYDLEKKRQL